jgi:lipopolysaccharide export system protein LptA
MRRSPELAGALVLVAVFGSALRAEPSREPGADRLFDAGKLGNRKQPIVITSDTLEYDYKANVVVYRGRVQAEQGEVKLSSDTLTVTFANAKSEAGASGDGGVTVPGQQGQRLREIVALGNVRIDNGARWATGGRAVFDQGQRTLVLTDGPMLHDGSNEVVGDRVVVYLDEDRSVVEGGRRRVKAVLYPDKESGLAPSTEKRPGAAGAQAAPSEGATAKAGEP